MYLIHFLVAFTIVTLGAGPIIGSDPSCSKTVHVPSAANGPVASWQANLFYFFFTFRVTSLFTDFMGTQRVSSEFIGVVTDLWGTSGVAFFGTPNTPTQLSQLRGGRKRRGIDNLVRDSKAFAGEVV